MATAGIRLVRIPTRSFSRMMPDFDPNIDYYSKLGVTKIASESDLKKAYYSLA
jgi:hypothetical protein